MNAELAHMDGGVVRIFIKEACCKSICMVFRQSLAGIPNQFLKQLKNQKVHQEMKI